MLNLDKQANHFFERNLGKTKFCMLPNIFKGMANSSVMLDSYLKLDELIAKLDLPAEPEI